MTGRDYHLAGKNKGGAPYMCSAFAIILMPGLSGKNNTHFIMTKKNQIHPSA